MDEKLYKGNKEVPHDKILYAARHAEAFRYAVLCLITGAQPESKYANLFDEGLSELVVNPTQALRFEQRIRKYHEIKNISNIATIIDLMKTDDENRNNYNYIEENHAA